MKTGPKEAHNMKRTITILLIALTVVAFFWASASAGYIEDLTLGDINGPKIGTPWRDGLITGVFLTLTASKAVSCQMFSAKMLKAGLETALINQEITLDWTVYRASLYVLVRAGCKATATEKPDV